MPSLLQQINSELSAIVKQARQSLVQITNGRGGGIGSGTIWHGDGLIITNAHVVQRNPLNVILPDGKKLAAKVLAHDPDRDLAALAIESKDLPAMQLGNSKTLQPGQLVLALGHPWGVTGAVSAGPVIKVGLPPELPGLGREFVQAGLQLRPGHSGGPMIDALGRLVGINTLITGPEVGLAVPLHVVKEFLKEALASSPI